MPTTMFGGGTPVDCTFCSPKDGNCDFGDLKEMSGVKNGTPDFNDWWVKKYCTMTIVDEFTRYFPYVLLIMPIIMIAVEKGLIKYKILFHKF